MKLVITIKWMRGALQYPVRLRDWNPNPQIKRDQFAFNVPKGAREIETIAANEMGEIEMTGEAK